MNAKMTSWLHCRSFWILDDLSPLQQAARDVPDGTNMVTISIPRHAYRLAGGSGFGGGGEESMVQAVRDRLLVLGEVWTVSLSQLQSELPRVCDSTLSTQPDQEVSPGSSTLLVHTGHNRIVWNLRHENTPNIPGAYVFGSLFKAGA